MALTFGEDFPCQQCRGNGTTILGSCPVCGGSGIMSRKTAPSGPALDIPHPTREGERLRDEGMARVAEAEPRWLDQALAHIEALPGGAGIEAESLTDAVGSPEHPNAVGAAFGVASRRGWIRPVGFVQSSKPSRHAGRALRWERVR